jgi:pyruvate formate lyase activating enzyme
MKATIFDIERGSFVDGPGIRTTVFFKGCNLRCAWCHNPESQNFAPEMAIFKNRCIGCSKCAEKCPHDLAKCKLCGKCVLYCPQSAREIYGKEYTLDEVIAEVSKDIDFYSSSGGGVTFSGGECMLQIDFLEALLRECKARGIHTAVDTAGQVPYEYFERVMPHTDLFLYDVKCFDSETHARYTGVNNYRILENLKNLLCAEAPLWIRIPVIPSVNDSEDEMRAIAEFLCQHGRPQRVELLPYHAMGEHKYDALGKEKNIFRTPDAEAMQKLKSIFAERGLTTN